LETEGGRFAFFARHGRPAAAVAIVLLVVAWIASGVIGREPLEEPVEDEPRPMAVAVAEHRAERWTDCWCCRDGWSRTSG